MYVVETIICSALLYALYRLLLEGRVAHSVARAYLLLSVVLAVVIPLLELPILPSEPTFNVVVTPLEVAEESAEVSTSVAVERTFDWFFALQTVYIVIVLLSIIRFCVSITKICMLRRHSKLSHYRRVAVAENKSISEPFSFIRTIFVQTGEKREQVLLHEYSHISHLHTLERLFFELARCLMWFNPFVHLMGNSISQVHEWQADSDVISAGFDINEYRQIIFHQLFGYSPDITCGLNKSLTKKRFIMMTTFKFKRGRFPLLRILAVIPIVVAMIFAFGAVTAKAEPTVVDSPEPKNVIEIRKGGEQIMLNSKPVTLNKLPELIEQTADHIVTIDAEADVPMGKVTDVKEALRGVENLRINYAKSDDVEPQIASETTERAPGRNGPEIKIEVMDGGKTILFCGAPMSYEQLLKTLPQVKPHVVILHVDNDVPEQMWAEIQGALRGLNTLKANNVKPEPQSKTVKACNLLQVKVAADGTILLRGKECRKNELKREVKHFVQNYHIYAMNTRRLHIGNLHNKEYSDFSTTSLTMPNGRKVCCPVSNGMISVSSDSNAAFDTVQQVLNTISSAYNELRQSLSRRVYNKSYDKLDIQYKQMIDNAIPIRVYMAES